jgi:hypothetical protein
MQFPDLPDLWEEETQTQEKSREKPIEFTVKPTGEMSFKGVPDSDIVRQLIITSDYHKDQNRRQQSESEKRIDDESRMINLMTIGFLGTSFLVCILCFFLSINKNQNQNQGNLNYAGEPIRRNCAY